MRNKPARDDGGTWWTLQDACVEELCKVIADVERVVAAKDAMGMAGEIVTFGSVVNGFHTSNSDCDLTYLPNDGDTDSPVEILGRFALQLPSRGFSSIIRVFQASIPVLKVIGEDNTEIDLCVRNTLGWKNSKLIATYCSLDWRVEEVGMLVKHWSKCCEIAFSCDGHLNSYAYSLLTIFYLMHTQDFPVVPNLQDLAFDDESDWVRDLSLIHI